MNGPKYFRVLILFTLLVFPFAACTGHPSTVDEHRVSYLKGSPAPVNLPNAKIPFDDVLTGGPPTFEQLRVAHSLGFRTVIDLRPATEQGEGEKESSWAEKVGLRYISIPVNGKEGVTIENAKLLTTYLDDRSNYPLIVHCASGNRVGALFAMKAFHLDGKDAQTALQIGKEAGLAGLEPIVRERLKR